MGTKLNKKNEKRKNIHRKIAGTRYKKEIISNKARYTNWPSPIRELLFIHISINLKFVIRIIVYNTEIIDF